MVTGEQKALEIAHSLYEGVLAPGGWAGALEQIRSLTESASACMLLRDRQTKAAFISDQSNIDKRLLEEYIAHYYAYDPGYDMADRYDVGDWFVDYRDLDRKILQKGEFHQEFLRAYDLNSVQATPLLKTDRVECFLSLQSGDDVRERAMPDQSAILRWLQPHFEQAARLRHQLHVLQRQGELAVRVLDAFTFPVLVANQRGAVQLGNRAAEDWLAIKGNPFSAQGLRHTCSGAAAMTQALSQACAGTHRLATGGAVLEYGEPLQRYYIVIVPLPDAMGMQLPGQDPLALIMVHAAQHEKRPVDLLLRMLFGISPAEYRLIEKLMQGLPIKTCAFELGISLETARSHLKSIFRRTQTSRQVDLLRLVQQLAYGY
ncbi:MAG TPA: hypothetical protein VM512_14425 [Burkholderiaceae bacterium]|nr:hypothetical protein [Burkholderiaceae bacterium]